MLIWVDSLKRGVSVGVFSRKKKTDDSLGVPQFGEDFSSVPPSEKNPIAPKNSEFDSLPNLDPPLYEGSQNRQEFDFPGQDNEHLDLEAPPGPDTFLESDNLSSSDSREPQPLDFDDSLSETDEQSSSVELEDPHNSELPMLESRTVVGPIFVKMTAYIEALNVLHTGTEEVDECLNISMSFFDIMTAEQKANERLQSELMAINKKLYRIDEILFEKR
jgi:hypothetical protein